MVAGTVGRSHIRKVAYQAEVLCQSARHRHSVGRVERDRLRVKLERLSVLARLERLVALSLDLLGRARRVGRRAGRVRLLATS